MTNEKNNKSGWALVLKLLPIICFLLLIINQYTGLVFLILANILRNFYFPFMSLVTVGVVSGIPIGGYCIKKNGLDWVAIIDICLAVYCLINLLRTLR